MSGGDAYRSVFSRLFDDPDYQKLSQRARHLLLTARQCRSAGPSAIFRYYPETLGHQTGLTVAQVQAALEELKVGGWVVYDEAVLWVRNGLRFDPSMTLANEKHRKAITSGLDRLPKSPVVLKFCDYYKIAYPSGWGPLPMAISDPESETDPETSTVATDQAREWLAVLNREAGRDFQPTKGNLSHPRARIAEGFTVEQASTVVRAQVQEWRGGKMDKFLRPETLFGPKFDSYLQAAINGQRAGQMSDSTRANLAATTSAAEKIRAAAGTKAVE